MLDSHTRAKLYHKYSRMVAEILVMAYPIWNCNFLILILLVATLCLLGYGIKSAKVHNYKLIEVGIIEYLLLLVFLVFASCLVVSIFAFSFFAQDIFVYCFIFAISTPLIGTFIPLALLFTIHIPISATCKQH